MRMALAIIAVAIAGLTIGLGTANVALDRGFTFQTEQIDGWTAWVNATTSDADPYTRAHFSRNGELPVPPLESLTFTTQTDSEGAPLRGACRYRIEGDYPPSRFWTLIAYTATGDLIPNPSNRNGYSNRTVLRRDGANLLITLASDVSPGNWIPLAEDKNHQLRLTLYDSPIAAESLLVEPVLPKVIRERCN